MSDFDAGRTRTAQGAPRLPPSVIEAEESLIGAMLLSPDAVAIAYEAVRPEDFYRPLHGQIFAAIIGLSNSGEPIDYVTVQNRVQEHGAAPVDISVLTGLTVNTPSTANALHYATLVREKAQQRKLISVASEIVDEAYRPTDDVDMLIDQAEARINAIGDERSFDTVSHIQDLLMNEANILEARGETRGEFNGVSTGYLALDTIVQGLQPGSMNIVGARPGAGKTAFALGILTHVGAVAKRPALFFSLEMSRQEITERILSSTGRIDSTKLRTGDLNEADWNRTHDAFSYLGSAQIFIDDNPGLTTLDVRARARRIKQQQGDLGIVIIDYLQLMSSRGRYENRQTEVAEMSRNLKMLARELNTPVVALSQLSRKAEERNDKRPMMSDLRESGSLEQDADIVMFIHRPEMWNKDVENAAKGDAEIIVGKNRNGPTGIARMTWRPEFGRFENIANNPI
jgi:replicative DNA helicase